MIYIYVLVCLVKAHQKIGIAAPESILKAAGGAITNLDNQQLSYGKTSFQQGGIIVATNDKGTHPSICVEIKKIIKDKGIYPI